MSVTWFKTNRSRLPLGITRRVQPPSTDKKISSRVRSVQTISYQAKETFIVIVSSAIVLTPLSSLLFSSDFPFAFDPLFLICEVVIGARRRIATTVAVTYVLSSVTNLLVLHSIFRPRLWTTGSALSPAKIFVNCGRNSNASVAVVEAKIKAVIVTKAKVARSDIKFASTTTIPEVITTK